jgi:hypothetical protein
MDARKVALLISVVLLASGIVAVAQMAGNADNAQTPNKPAWPSDTTRQPSDLGPTDRLQADTGNQQCQQIANQLKTQMQEIKTAQSSLQAAINKLDTAGDDKAKIAALTDAVKAINTEHQAMGKVFETHKQVMAHNCGHLMQGMDGATRMQMNRCPLMKDDLKSDTGIKTDADRIKSDADKLKSDAERIRSDAEKKASEKPDWNTSN